MRTIRWGGRRLRTPLARLYGSEGGRWLLAGGISLSILTAVFLLIRPVFMTIDDARLQYVYAGYASGMPESVYLFSYYPWSRLISTLYLCMPRINWYAFYHFAAIGLSSTLIGKTIYKVGFRRGFKLISAVGLHVFLYISMELISTILIHFEVTAAILGTAGVVLLLGVDSQNDRRAVRALDLVLSLLCVFGCYVIQYNACYAVLCYLMVAFLARWLQALQKGGLKRTVYQLACCGLCVLAIIVGVKHLDDQVKDTPAWNDYREYNAYRVPFWDYPHVTYDESPEMFEDMGWSKEFYSMTENMYFMDSRFSKENLERFLEKFSWTRMDSFGVMLDNAGSSLRSLYRGDRLAIVQTVLALALAGGVLVLTAASRKWRKEHYPQWLSILCCFGGTLVLIFFLAARSRLPLRAWLACMIPCVTTVTLLMWTSFPKSFVLKGIRHIRMDVVYAAVLLLAVVWAGAIVWSFQEIVGTDWTNRQTPNANTKLLEEYVMDHPENVYVYDNYCAQNYNVFTNYPDPEHRPTNAFVWGSSYLFTPAYYRQLERCGRTQLLTENLFDENVYFIAGKVVGSWGKLRGMLEKEYGPIKGEQIDTLGPYLVVYKIEKS